MKKTNKTTLALFSCFFFFLLQSCEKHSDEAVKTPATMAKSDPLNFEGLQFKDLNLQLGKFPKTIFTYTDPSSRAEHLNTKFQSFLDEVDEIKKSDERIDVAVFNVTFSNGAAVLNNLYFLDQEGAQIIPVFDDAGIEQEDRDQLSASLY